MACRFLKYCLDSLERSSWTSRVILPYAWRRTAALSQLGVNLRTGCPLASRATYLPAPGVTQDLLMLSRGGASAQGTWGSATEDRNITFRCKAVSAATARDAGVPGEDHHHGVKVDGAVSDSLQHKLFIYDRTKRLFGNSGKTKPSRLLLPSGAHRWSSCHAWSAFPRWRPRTARWLWRSAKKKKRQSSSGEHQEDRPDMRTRTRSPLFASSGCTLPCSVRPVLKPAFLHSRKRPVTTATRETECHSTGVWVCVCDATVWLSWTVLLRVPQHYQRGFSGPSANSSTGSQHSGEKQTWFILSRDAQEGACCQSEISHDRFSLFISSCAKQHKSKYDTLIVTKWREKVI